MVDEEMMRLRREDAAVDVFALVGVDTTATDADISSLGSVIEVAGDTGIWSGTGFDSDSILELQLLEGGFPLGDLDTEFNTSSIFLLLKETESDDDVLPEIAP